MNMKKIESDTSFSVGYGAGHGEIIIEVYECPCGAGKVYYEKDDIPGFKSSDTYTDCPNCEGLYDFKRGIATKKV